MYCSVLKRSTIRSILPKPFSTYGKEYWHLLQKGHTMAKLSCCQHEWSCCVHYFYSGLVICQQECSLYFGVIMERKVKPCATENWNTFHSFGSTATKVFCNTHFAVYVSWSWECLLNGNIHGKQSCVLASNQLVD